MTSSIVTSHFDISCRWRYQNNLPDVVKASYVYIIYIINWSRGKVIFIVCISAGLAVSHLEHLVIFFAIIMVFKIYEMQF